MAPADGWPNAKEERNNAVGDADPGLDATGAAPDAHDLERTVYGVVPWRGRTGAELCGVIFNPSNRWERSEIGLWIMHSGAGSWKDVEAGAADRKHGWCRGRECVCTSAVRNI
jgi:hypothetical protein